ncbi:hypothetical protein [Edaphobacter albus]|uniref:hypothetical protein n=1 Tax=Edaphobacter sp. 4G125 TaxID=2763071 RepID=UPI0016489AB1|nr:hypothetical protein [Edaphobacter sp. 4G125]QNI36820.1 hypothetical protein H7846_00270 [Edaphobacter sp. 4G125]
MTTPLHVVALRRMTDAMFYGSGARSVLLRIPAPANAVDPGEQLGFAAPQFQDVELTPVVFRSSTATMVGDKAKRRELLVSATAVEALAGLLSYGSANTFFASAAGVVVDDLLLAITNVSELEAGGLIYAYKLVLREPPKNTV